ncbi:MAG: glycosyltransferase [Acidithiobacillus sp.]|uniref:glycosyltransferase n=1 Tax=Acidithiobacillus sp. TaxID=1872118 RepID=UPI003D03CA2E
MAHSGLSANTLLEWLAVLATWAAALAWGVLYLARGRFWRCDERLAAEIAPLSRWPAVTAVVPARNEAAGIGACVRSILGQDYPGDLRLIVVDDQSSDGTAALAREAAAAVGAAQRLRVLRGRDLPAGWAGKVWAQSQGVAAAGEVPWLWFTDADIQHGETVLRRLVAKAEGEQRVLVSLMVELSCRSFWERLLIPAFVFFFQKLYPFAWVNDPGRPLAGAAGGCMLLRRDALERAGGLARMRAALIDDCTLAGLLKPLGPIWLGLTHDSRSLRVYPRLGEIWSMVARSAYVQLEQKPSRLLLAVSGMIFLYLWPLLALVYGVAVQVWWLWLPALAALLLAWRMYLPMLRFYALPWWWGASLFPAAWLYTLMTADSGRRHYLGRGGAWKGRHYS